MTGCVLLAAEGNALTLSATNMDLAIVARLDAEVQDAGGICVPARLFSDLVHALPDDRVEMQLQEKLQTLLVRAPRCEAHARGVDAAEFPRIDRVGEAPVLGVPAPELRAAVEEVLFSAARDETRPQLAGVLLRLRGSELTAVACDSFRLALRTLHLAAPVADDLDLIVPRQAIATVAAVQCTRDEALTLAVSANRSLVLFQTASVDVISRLVEGAYVAFERVLAQTEKHDITITASTADLQRAARFTSFVARDANQVLRLKAKAATDGGTGTLALQAAAAPIGENATELDAVVAGGEVSIAVDNTYVVDALAALRTAEVAISAAAGQMLPIAFRPVGREDALHIVMPMHSSA